MAEGAVTLEEKARTHKVIEVRCKRCDRFGRYRIETLIERFGADARMPDVASELEEGCEYKGKTMGGCFVYFVS